MQQETTSIKALIYLLSFRVLLVHNNLHSSHANLKLQFKIATYILLLIGKSDSNTIVVDGNFITYLQSENHQENIIFGRQQERK